MSISISLEASSDATQVYENEASSLGNDVPHKAVGHAVHRSCQWVCPLHARMSSANKTTDRLWLMSHTGKACLNWAQDNADSADYLHFVWDSQETGTHLFYFMQIFYCAEQNSYYRSEASNIYTLDMYMYICMYIQGLNWDLLGGGLCGFQLLRVAHVYAKPTKSINKQLTIIL